MVARAYTVAFHGVEARLVEVQCSLSPGMPAFNIVGLPDKAVSEAKERVRAAMSAMALALPSKRITINLSPADITKEGSHFDLPIALALMAAMDVIPQDEVARQVALGELSLDGKLIPVIGTLPAALAAAEADCNLVCPADCGAEAAWVGAVQVIAPSSFLAGLLSSGGISKSRPFRDPHHTASMAAIVGGGRGAKPGEISLAHNGVLFLDELPEFTRQVLETLRQPLETGSVMVARANNHVTYPCRFMLISAANPCRCGYLADAERACARVPVCGQDYLGKISGPLMDRFDLRVEVPPVSMTDLTLPDDGETSETIAARVATARRVQSARFKDHADLRQNADAEGSQLEEIATPSSEGAELLNTAADRFKLSARGYHRILRVARTIADLAGSNGVEKPHVAEAISYRLVSAAP